LTEQKENERLARQQAEADERAQLIFDSAPFACTMFGKNINMIDCNQETVRMFGIPDKEFFLTRALELFPEYQPSGATTAEDAVTNVGLALEKGYHRFEQMYRKMDGGSLPAEVTLVRIKHRGEHILASYMRALTERKAREQLKKLVTEKTSMLSAVFDSTHDILFCKDNNLLYTDCNKAMEAFFNVRRSDIIGRREADALDMPPEIVARLTAMDKSVIAEKRTVISEETVRGCDGNMVRFEIIRSPLVQEGKVVGVVGMARDLTQRDAIMELEKRNVEAEAANRAKSAFLATMSHEIRTPMNAILGMAEIQLQDEGLPLSAKEALNIIYNSGYSLLGIINDLLDLSKIEAGKLELVNSRYETAGLISDTINLNTARIGDKRVEFKMVVDEDMPLEMIGDELRIKQILNNLLSNAFKYTDSGEVMLSLSADAADDENSPSVLLTIAVKDTGQGMDDEQVRSIFDVYSRFNMEANRSIEGTGLGMSIVQHLVEEMGGDISVQSELGKGTEVIVCVKQGYVGPNSLGSDLAGDILSFRMLGGKTKKSQIVREPMPYGRVMVVDDMETNLYVARGFLVPYGLTIDTALSGYEAIAKTIERGKDYDIIFMDHMMPGMDGIETVKNMRAKGYTRPIVALTANAVTGQAEVFMANGFDGFISKPIDMREMNASLNKFVRDKHPPEVVEAARAAWGGAAQTAEWDEAAQTADEAPLADPGLAKIFIRDAEKAIIAVQKYDGSDLQSYIINVHGLKGALANIGEAKLSALAKDLEQAGRESALDFIADMTPGFLAGLQEVLEGLKAGLAEEEVGEASSEDMAHLRKMLLAAKAACANYDIDGARAALKEISQRQWPRPINSLLDTIAEHLLNSEFEKAEEACGAQLSDVGAS
jgi:PAS domain S-box-containing protein